MKLLRFARVFIKKMSLDMDFDQQPQAKRPSVFKQRMQQQREGVAAVKPRAVPATHAPAPPPVSDLDTPTVAKGHERCVYTVNGHGAFGTIYFMDKRVIITYCGDTIKLCGAFDCTGWWAAADAQSGFISVLAGGTQFDTIHLVPVGRDLILELRTPAAPRRVFYRNETPERLRAAEK
jgi:hypothetical protein